jgi:hypothetical protein
MRNRIINGAMVIDQRNAGAAITASGFPVDRFGSAFSTDGAFSAQQDSSAPAGFTNSVKCTTTTADASLSASQYWFFRQRIEGYNVADLGFGTAAAKTITLSFWVRSSLTGTFSGSVLNGDTNRSYPFNYTISAADTWEQKSVTIAGDTSGTWNKTNGNGMVVAWSLGIGSNFQGTANAWGAAEAYGTAGSVSVIGTLSATWYVTGVQLEVGTQATSFEYRQYQQELALCQRYFWTSGAGAGGVAYSMHGTGMVHDSDSSDIFVQFPVNMRASPTVTFSNLICVVGGTSSNVIAINDVGGTTHTTAFLRCDHSAGFTVGNASMLYNSNNANGFLRFSSEL